MYVKPATGMLVRDPERGYQQMPGVGATVPRNNYWLRRIKDGSVHITEPPTVKTTKQPEAK
jgi:hypothetical protein